MPGSTLNYTTNGWPYLDDQNYVDITDDYSSALANKLETDVTQLSQDAAAAAAAANALAGTFVVAAGRPDIPSTTPYTATQLNAMPVGMRYRSTDGPQGAWEWRKTDAASWTAIDADTGWRIMPTPTGFDTSSHGLRIRRIGSTVWLVLRVTPSAERVGQNRVATSPTLFDPLPTGFAFSPSEVYMTHSAAFVLSTVNGAFYGHSSSSRLQVHGMTGAWVAGDVLNGTTQWTTANAWPTTLPGTAA